MIRLGFGARLLLIVITGLVALQLLVIMGYFLQRSRDTETGFRLPVPDQAAALVELLEATPKPQWPLVLRAANSADLARAPVGCPARRRRAALVRGPRGRFHHAALPGGAWRTQGACQRRALA